MRIQSLLAFVGVGVLAAALVALWPRSPSSPEPPQPSAATVFGPAEIAPPSAPIETPIVPQPEVAIPSQGIAAEASPPEPAPAPPTKAERLTRIRDTFRAMAAGDPRTALRAARQLTDETERETALLALVTEWKHGELSPPRQRAWAIATQGLEAGLGAELARDPELAQAWAAELTNAQSRAVSPERLGPAMVEADPAAALAYGQQLGPDDRRKFLDGLFVTWAQKDTEAALQAAGQLSDPAEQDQAVQAIRRAAPVGIGVQLTLQEGYPVIQQMFPGTPAELSGQLHQGDRILAFAQGNNAFVDARGLSMQDLVQGIRGAPGTLLQLQVLPADASPGVSPRTIAIVRDQIKFKR
jgi:PDZ domain